MTNKTTQPQGTKSQSCPWSELQLKLQIIRSQDSYSMNPAAEANPMAFNTFLICFDILKLLASEGQTTSPQQRKKTGHLQNSSRQVCRIRISLWAQPHRYRGREGQGRANWCCPSLCFSFPGVKPSPGRALAALQLIYLHSLSSGCFCASGCPCEHKSQTSAPVKPCWAVLYLHQGFKLQLLNPPTSFAQSDGLRVIPAWFEPIFSMLMLNIHIIAAQELMKTISYNA